MLFFSIAIEAIFEYPKINFNSNLEGDLWILLYIANVPSISLFEEIIGCDQQACKFAFFLSSKKGCQFSWVSIFSIITRCFLQAALPQEPIFSTISRPYIASL